jgi:hypothetical protein
LHLPVEAYMGSPARIAQETQARSILFRECLAKFGIRTVYPQDSGRQRGPATLTELRYGNLDVARAAAYGYWWPGDDRPAPAVATPGKAEQDVSSGAVSTFKGRPVPQGGCDGEVTRTLDGADAAPGTYLNAFRAANEMEMDSFHRTRQNPKVQAAEKTWSTCMKDKGYDLPADVFSASDRLHLPEVRPRPKPGDEETRVAVADTECKNRSRVATVWNALEVDYQRRVIAQSPQKWSAVQGVFRRHFAAVDAVLRSHHLSG